MIKILILGGTKDAVNLAEAASALSRVHVIYSLAGVTRNPNLPNCQTRSGGFGGEDGLADYLRDENIDAVVDATHPYAGQMAAHTAAAAGRLNMPRLKFLRPPWTPQPGEQWHSEPSIADAASYVGDSGGRVFLTVGVKELSAFAGAGTCWFLTRYIHPPANGEPVTNGIAIVDRGPFTMEGERQLLQDHKIDTLVTKNSGGDGVAAKLVAARELGVKIVMIDRPALPPGEVVSRQADAINWIDALI